VVIFIVSIMLMVSFPYFNMSEGGRLKSEAAILASLFRYLNDSAVHSKETYPVKIDLHGKTLSYEGPDGRKAQRIDDLAGVTLQSKGTVSEGEVIIFFTPSGGSESFAIHLRGEDSVISVDVNSLSGRVGIRLQEG
jgi:Tfp pilus assembly protein FimT